MKKILLLIILLFVFINNLNANVDLTEHSKSSILIESSTGKILYEKNIHEKMSPASMTKIMTLLLSIEAIESNKISYDDQVFISKNASSMGGTQIFVKENTYVSVKNLLKGIGIASANDASVAMAEHISGNEKVFVNLMNEWARELECKDTNFMNPHGLDEDNHYTTAYDLSLIARELVTHRDILDITSTYEDHIEVSGSNHWIVNTNKLVRFYEGIDGLKTGYTDNAKYCLTATKKKNNMRLISIVMSSDTKDNRTKDTISLLEYGFSNYGLEAIIDSNIYKKQLYVDNAKDRIVYYGIKSDINMIVEKGKRDIDYEVKTKLNNISAPLSKNSKVGEIKLKYNNESYTYDLIIFNDIKKSNYLEVIYNTFKSIISGIHK